MRIEVNEGKTPWVIGIAAILVGIGIGSSFILTAVHGESASVKVAAYTAVLLIIISGIWLCMNAANRKLTVEGETICYVNWYGGKKMFLLDGIGYCKAAFENRGSNDYLKVYDLLGNKLCKLEFHMKDCPLFLQYLIDNRIRIECSERSDSYLKNMVHTRFLCAEEIPENIEHIYEAAQTQTAEWLKKNARFGVGWKTGIAVYLEKDMREGIPLFEQKGYTGNVHPAKQEAGQREQTELPEGLLIVLEGYLQKDGLFVMDKKNRAVSFNVPVIRVTKSLQIGEKQKIRFFENTAEELSEQLVIIGGMLPVCRYHTEDISPGHELYVRPPFGLGD